MFKRAAGTAAAAILFLLTPAAALAEDEPLTQEQTLVADTDTSASPSREPVSAQQMGAIGW
ncbi:hypothetical protein [Nonomuraea sp. SYSU D8015]|uniref:hypothetical protein n=1 Tax=Nonomuraea sp. SYSU D8015 TaxID=2593644 RepID=UPI0016615D92|nr:hypothetical protein [Nonomuraea sp. SYSU D8015]